MAQPPQLFHGLSAVRAARQGQGGTHAAAQAVEVRGLGLHILARSALEEIFVGKKYGKIPKGWENDHFFMDRNGALELGK